MTRFTAASARLGFSAFELRVETIDPNARAEMQPHDRDRVAIVSVGHGDLRTDGAAQRFRAPCSLVMARNTECEVTNIGTETMHLVLGVAPPVGAPDVGPSPAP